MKYPTWTPKMLSRINKPATHGVCSCGECPITVSRYEYKEIGKNKHSRRRCTDRAKNIVHTGAQW